MEKLEWENFCAYEILWKDIKIVSSCFTFLNKVSHYMSEALFCFSKMVFCSQEILCSHVLFCSTRDLKISTKRSISEEIGIQVFLKCPPLGDIKAFCTTVAWQRIQQSTFLVSFLQQCQKLMQMFAQQSH